ncbi:MAG: FtsB family cell division protein [Chitinophagaceae bacterium]
MKKATSIITNKYILAIVFFIIWMCFFDQRNVFNLLEQKEKLQALEVKKNYYESEISKAREELNNLNSNPAALEKFAREKYLLKKDGEDIYIVNDSVFVKK